MDNRDKFITANDVLVGIRTFKECYKENEKVFSPELVEFAYTVLNMVEEFINRTPPIDAVKVVHGRWVDKEDYYTEIGMTCSVCCARYWIDDGFEEHDYCPNCGARMDGGN